MNTVITDYPPITSYELCDPSGVLEADFEEVSKRILARLRPDCCIIPFRPKVYHDDAVWQPDLAIVASDFSHWFIVEVEIADHHLQKHILPQVTAFVEGRYEQDAASLLSKELGVGLQEANTLLSTIPREVVVISNCQNAQWTEKLASISVRHIIVATYRNKLTSQNVHKVEGELLPAQRCLGFGRVRLKDGVIITQPKTFWKDGVYEMAGPNGLAQWRCIVENQTAWLMKERGLIEFHDDAIIQFIQRHDKTILVQMPYAR